MRKWFTKCDGCRKKKLVVSTRKIELPMGQIAESQNYFCRKCFGAVKSVIK